MKSLTMADLFCGAGGTSEGAIQAASALGYKVSLTAVNHWPVAVATHTANHPDARHLCASLDSLNPRDLFKQGGLDMLWASPECTHHSRARGGKPIHDQSRATAWCVVRWAEALLPPFIAIENVPEFAEWGPLGCNGRPLASRKGETFRAWCAALASLGYAVDHRILCAADYGDPTTRRRLFVQAARGRKGIRWPEPTHSPKGTEDLFGTRKAWVPAREIIDWEAPCGSIFERKRPLSPNTLRRIWAGLEKFGLRPMTVSAGGPACPAKPTDQPLGTVLTRDHRALVQPFIIAMEHGGSIRSVDVPLNTVTTAKGGAHAVCEPHLLPQGGGADSRPVSEPCPTIATSGAIALVEPFLVSYYGNGAPVGIGGPLPTVTCKDRMGLVRPKVVVDGKQYLLEIRFRMLMPKELAAAQGFPKSYRFTGTKTEAVKQIGNAVPCGLARAIVTAALS